MGQQVSKSQEMVMNGCVPKKKKEPEPEMTLQEKNEIFFIIGLLPFGNNLDDRKREAIVGDVRRKKYEEDDIVVKQGEVISEIFIITDGHANVYLEDNEKKMPQEVRTLGKGECFGAGLRPGQKADATISAKGDRLTLLTISRDACEKHGVIERMQNEPIPEPKKKASSKTSAGDETPRSTAPSLGTKMKEAIARMLKSPNASRKSLHEEPSEPMSPISPESHSPIPTPASVEVQEPLTNSQNLKVPEITVESPKSAEESSASKKLQVPTTSMEPMEIHKVIHPIIEQSESPLLEKPVAPKEVVAKEQKPIMSDPVLAAWTQKVSTQATEGVYSPKNSAAKLPTVHAVPVHAVQAVRKDDNLNSLIFGGEEKKPIKSAADDAITAMIFGNYSTTTTIHDNPYLALSKMKPYTGREETPIFGAPCLKIAAIDTSCVDSAHRLGESGWSSVGRADAGIMAGQTSSSGLIPPSMNIPIVSDVLPPQCGPLFPPELDIPRVEAVGPALSPPQSFGSPRFSLEAPTRLVSCPGTFQPRLFQQNSNQWQDENQEVMEGDDVQTDAEGVLQASGHQAGLGFSLVQPQINQFAPTPRLYTGPSLLNGGYQMSPRHNMQAPRLNLPRMISH